MAERDVPNLPNIVKALTALEAVCARCARIAGELRDGPTGAGVLDAANQSEQMLDDACDLSDEMEKFRTLVADAGGPDRYDEHRQVIRAVNELREEITNPEKFDEFTGPIGGGL